MLYIMLNFFGGKFSHLFPHSAGQQWETERVDLEGKPAHPPPPLQLGQQVRKRKSYIQASFRVCRNPKRNALFPLLTTGFTLHRQSSIIIVVKGTPSLCVLLKSNPNPKQGNDTLRQKSTLLRSGRCLPSCYGGQHQHQHQH